MKKYIVFGYTDIDTVDLSMEPTKEERQEIYTRWLNWKEEIGPLLVSLGSPLTNGVNISKEGLEEGKTSDLSGYMIIKAENPEHAHEILSKSPLFDKGHGQKYELFECVM